MTVPSIPSISKSKAGGSSSPTPPAGRVFVFAGGRQVYAGGVPVTVPAD